jgi:hypothetical protein
MHKLDVTTPGSARDVRKDECRVGEGDDKANVADRRLDERACIRLLYRGATPAQAVDDVAAGAMTFRIDFITRKNDRHSIRRMTQCPDTDSHSREAKGGLTLAGDTARDSCGGHARRARELKCSILIVVEMPMHTGREHRRLDKAHRTTYAIGVVYTRARCGITPQLSCGRFV